MLSPAHAVAAGSTVARRSRQQALRIRPSLFGRSRQSVGCQTRSCPKVRAACDDGVVVSTALHTGGGRSLGSFSCVMVGRAMMLCSRPSVCNELKMVAWRHELAVRRRQVSRPRVVRSCPRRAGWSPGAVGAQDEQLPHGAARPARARQQATIPGSASWSPRACAMRVRRRRRVCPALCRGLRLHVQRHARGGIRRTPRCAGR